MLDTLNAKLDEVKKQKEVLMSQINALIGAENVLLQLIEETQRRDDNGNP